MENLQKILLQLGVNSTIFIMIGLFIGTYLIVSFLAIRRVAATVVERSARTEGRDQEIYELRGSLTVLNEELETALKKARHEASEAFADLKMKAVEDNRNILQKAREQAAEQIKLARADVESRLAVETRKLREEIPEISRQILEQIAGGASSRKKSNGLTEELHK